MVTNTVSEDTDSIGVEFRKGYDRLFGKQWPIWVGGLLLGIGNVFLFAFDRPWTVSNGVRNWGDWVFNEIGVIQINVLPPNLFSSSVLCLGMIIGALVAALLGKQFKVRMAPARELFKGLFGGEISRVDPMNMQVETEFGMEKGDVINFIPAQQAGKIARDSGLANSKGWCPVNQVTFESELLPGVHVIGDSCIAGKMPKSGFSANSQGKVAAASIVSLFEGTKPITPSYANTCYSLVTPNHGISVAKVYEISDNKIVGIKGSGGLSPKAENADVRWKEAEYAQGWYDAITQDMFG